MLVKKDSESFSFDIKRMIIGNSVEVSSFIGYGDIYLACVRC